MAAEFNLNHFKDAVMTTRTTKRIPQVPAKVWSKVEEDMDRFLAMIDAMTEEERSKPGIIDQARQARVAADSGTSLDEVADLLKNFENMRQLMPRLAQLRRHKDD